MKKLVLVLVPLAMFAAEQNKPAQKPAPAAKAAPAAPVTIPPDAVEIAPRVYRHTDKAGKTWIYRQTPFGLSKVEELNAGAGTPAAAPVAAPQKVEVKATDLGDSVRFEKPTPMGNRVWTVKKADLSQEEKTWLENSRQASGSGTAAGK